MPRETDAFGRSQKEMNSYWNFLSEEEDDDENQNDDNASDEVDISGEPITVIEGDTARGADTDENPGDVINTRQGKFKAYRGMASKDGYQILKELLRKIKIF